MPYLSFLLQRQSSLHLHQRSLRKLLIMASFGSTSVSITTPAPYTIFTTRQKKVLVLLLSLANLASPLTATIYLPLLPLLEAHFQISLQAINLTITLYIVFQAISPLIFATSSDVLGRRPIIVTTFTVYTLASIGLVLNRHSYAGLLTLRALQSLGASAIQAVTYGIIADVCMPAQRGSMSGPIISMGNLGVNVGPLLGGFLAFKSGDFAWAFWGLVVFGGLSLLSLCLILNETARNIVGNGEAGSYAWWRCTWWNALAFRGQSQVKNRFTNSERSYADVGHPTHRYVDSTRVKGLLQKMSPWAAIRIMFYKDAALTLWMAASAYGSYYCIQASNPTIYKDIYHFNELLIGLIYLAGGAGVVLGSYANGKLMDRNYVVTAEEIRHEVDRVRVDNLNNFPIERARIRSCPYLLALSVCAWIGYGWSLEKRTNVSVPLIVQFVHGVLCTCILNTFNILLVDIFPKNPSTAATSGNLTRCALAALYVALLEPLVDALGRGWYFTLLGVLNGLLGGLAVWMLQMYGRQWRDGRPIPQDPAFGHTLRMSGR